MADNDVKKTYSKTKVNYMNEQKSKLQGSAVKSVVLLRKKTQSFKNEQKSAALTSGFGLNTTKLLHIDVSYILNHILLL